MSTAASIDLEEIWTVLRAVMDPELPHVSVVNLGMVRDVREASGRLEVVITPTYSGCPAMQTIEQDIRAALDGAGYLDAAITTVLSPPWTTDWIDQEGRRKLTEIGIAPPVGSPGSKKALFGDAPQVACPHCGSVETVQISEFGSTACKALWRCTACAEPFDYFKCL